MVEQVKAEKGTLRIKVSKEVVGHLSLGLYRNFARAVKEVISNSYDAAATEVKIKLDLDMARIVVRDDGRGMNLEEIKENFLTIGYRTPLTDAADELGRRRIGTFGIGCLSVFPYCDRLKIITKKRNSDSIIELDIDTKLFFTEEQTFRFIEQATVPYRVYPSDLPKEKGETIVVLEGLRPHIAGELQREESRGKSSIDRLSGFQKFKWTLSQYAPVQFPASGKDLRDFFGTPGLVPMRLWLDGEELFRNVPENAVVLEMGEEQFGNVSLKFAIMTAMRPIEPEEARGVQIRIRNVAVGLPRDFDVTKLTGKVLGKLNYLYGEAHILSGLDSALMIDRDSLSYTQGVANIYDFFRKQLIKWNDTLEKWASEDKQIYESLKSIKGADKVIEELRRANLIRFSKERLRLPRAPTLERRKEEVLPKSQKLYKALSRIKGYEIIRNKEEIPATKAPIKVIPKDHTILVYEQHRDFVENIRVGRQKFIVKYDEWDFHKTPYAICKLSQVGDTVVYNISHPLFKSRLSDEIIKHLSLGMLLIIKGRKDAEALLARLNRLLEQVFLG